MDPLLQSGALSARVVSHVRFAGSKCNRSRTIVAHGVSLGRSATWFHTFSNVGRERPQAELKESCKLMSERKKERKKRKEKKRKKEKKKRKEKKREEKKRKEKKRRLRKFKRD